MREEDVYDELPDDPEKAFLLLESFFRDECDSKINRMHDNDRADVFYVSYIGKVLATLEKLGLAEEFSLREVPKIGDIDYTTYLEFGKETEQYRTRLRIRHTKREKAYSVRFDPVAKQKLRFHLGEIRDIVDRLEIEEPRRTAIYDKLSRLESEIDRNRSRLDQYADLVIEVAGIAGEAGKKLEPVRKLLDSIAKLFGMAERGPAQQSLPAPKAPRQLPPAKKTPETPSNNYDLDDDIPF